MQPSKSIKHQSPAGESIWFCQKLRYTLANIKAKCYRENHQDFKYYGLRGITVCRAWLEDSKTFNEWAVNNGFREDLTLDRINNNKGYSPENCRWVEMSVQSRNKRNNIMLTIFSEKKCLTDWIADPRCSVTRQAIHYRIKKGWSMKDAILKPAGNNQ